MNYSPFRAGCIALAFLSLVCGQSASGAVLNDKQPQSSARSMIYPANKQAGLQTPDTLDGGYFKLEQEACLPPGPARQTVMRIIGTGRQASVADMATLSFSWRQIQHYRAEAVPVCNPPQCYYFAL